MCKIMLLTRCPIVIFLRSVTSLQANRKKTHPSHPGYKKFWVDNIGWNFWHPVHIFCGGSLVNEFEEQE